MPSGSGPALRSQTTLNFSVGAKEGPTCLRGTLDVRSLRSLGRWTIITLWLNSANRPSSHVLRPTWLYVYIPLHAFSGSDLPHKGKGFYKEKPI